MKKTSRAKKASASRSRTQAVAYELVTPELAGDWLAINPHNRKLRDQRVRRYAADMAAGMWKKNAETIKFGVDGNLLDGQHRLAAIVTSGVSVEMLIARNVPSESFDTIDTGIPRIVSDILYIRGEINSKLLGAALGYLQRYRAGGVFSRVPGTQGKNYEIEALLDNEPSIRQHITPGYMISRKLNIGQGLASTLRHILFEIDEDYAYIFWEGLHTGIDLKQADPVYRLRERLTGKDKLTYNEIAALTFKAWNSFRKGEKINILKWSATKEPMPRPV